MNTRERYQKLYEMKLQEFVLTKQKLDKLEKELGLLENWLTIDELEEQARALDIQDTAQGGKPE